MNEALRNTLKQLRLSGLLESLEIRLQEAAGHGLSHGEFLELILQDELAVRADRQFQRRFKAAEFRERKSLEDFDWSFNPLIPRKQVFDPAAGSFAGDCSGLGRRAWGRATWCKRLATKPSRPGIRSFTGRSSTWSATSCTTRCWAGKQDADDVPEARVVDHRRHGDGAIAEAFR